MEKQHQNDRKVSIRDLYFKLRKENPNLNVRDIADKISKSPAPKFYCSYENARRMISLLDMGKKLPISNTNKVAMYKDIYMIWSKKYKGNTHSRAIYRDTLSKILNSQAPSYYLDVDTVIALIYRSFKV